MALLVQSHVGAVSVGASGAPSAMRVGAVRRARSGANVWRGCRGAPSTRCMGAGDAPER